MVDVNAVDLSLLDSSSDDDGEINNPPSRNDIRILDPPNRGIKFTINRTPKPMSRSRFHNGGLANTCKQEMDAVKALLGQEPPPFCPIPDSVPLNVHISIYLRRPNTDFTNGVRGEGRLKATANNSSIRKGGDLDNYAKLYLDCMNKIVFADDSQIVHLKLLKALDNVGECNGRVVIQVKKWW